VRGAHPALKRAAGTLLLFPTHQGLDPFGSGALGPVVQRAYQVRLAPEKLLLRCTVRRTLFVRTQMLVFC
jgi:hypothetical protein